MKKTCFATLLMLAAVSVATAQTVMRVNKTDKSVMEIPVDDISSVDFVEPVSRAVDLGLSVMWSSVNIGAEKPEDYGWYLAYGETAEKLHYSYAYYSLLDENNSLLPNNVISGTDLDAATVLWGEEWHMPTLEEAKELIEKCTWQWEELNGVKGMRVTGTNGNSIFLPATGECSCTHSEKTTYLEPGTCDGYTPANPISAGVNAHYRIGQLAQWENGNWSRENSRYFTIVSSNPTGATIGSGYRCAGYPVRPVKRK